MIALHTDWSVHAGLQAFFNMSRHISPVYRTQKRTLRNTLSPEIHSHQCSHLPWNAHWDGIFWSRTALEEAAEDTVQEQQMQAETLRLHRESRMVPIKRYKDQLRDRTKAFIFFNLKREMLQWQNLDKCSPFENVGIITHQLNIRISYFLSLNLFVLLEQSSSWLLITLNPDFSEATIVRNSISTTQHDIDW